MVKRVGIKFNIMVTFRIGDNVSWLPKQKSSQAYPCERIFYELFGEEYCKYFACGDISDIYYPNNSDENNIGVFLPYIFGKISYVLLQEEKNVFSYPFSGCIMSAFRYSGYYIVCHIATDISSENDCKNIWYRFLSDFEILRRNECMLKQFKPYSDLEYTYGVISKDGYMYSINVRIEYDKNPPQNSVVEYNQKIGTMYFQFYDRIMQVYQIIM